MKENSFIKRIAKNKILLIMLLPAVLLTLFLSYIPMFGIVVAFKNLNYRDGILGSPWVGFDNFRYFLSSGKAVTVTLNTLFFNVIFIGATTIVAIAIAIFVSEISGKYIKKVFQSFMFLPFFISWVVVGAFMYNVFNPDTGMLNTMLVGMGQSPINIYSEPIYWYFIMPIMRVWKFAGYNSVIFLSAIMGIDGECLEAATIDGANRFQKIFKIILPLLKPTIIMMIMLSLGGILRGDFDMFYNLIGNNSMVFSKTDIIDTFVFRSLITSGDIGMASAAAFYQSVVCFLFITIVNGIVRKINKEYALY